ncbi:hypothetical protein [uncultured Paludibaculum sp.]|uniref:hypothetical protein n=1 Tax=uncultured Paludibaculum sp. TaxID=1765020 RepID=UPI002AAADDC7|nr:hypothetical protein [uncultured Paludibaculum sp.]
MAILKNVQPAATHTCRPPDKPQFTYGAGTVWACDSCGRQARLVEDQRDGWLWMWMNLKDYIKPRKGPEHA